MLKFSPANTKLQKLAKKTGKIVYSFDLLSGHNCPFANICLSKAVIMPDGKRKVQDGPNTQFRCYSASQEARMPAVYDLREHNTNILLKSKNNTNELYEILRDNIPSNAEIIRIHSAGDFFSQAYFDAWLKLAQNLPKVTFYAYTKSLRFWINRLDKIPQNLVLTASYGGLDDKLIRQHKLRASLVIYDKIVARKLNLHIDKDDSLAYNRKYKYDFCLLIHGVQPKNTIAAKSWDKIKRNITREKKKS